MPLANGTIGPGYQGDDVTRVQQRLTELGFAPGPIDGQFGSLTKMAVWAFEKLVMETDREKAKGLVTPEIWDRMQDPIVVQPRREVSETPRHTEIYLPEQVLAVFDGNKAVFVSHISTGDNSEWCEEVTISPGENGNENGTEPLKRGECGKSITPGGVYQYKRRVIGRRESGSAGCSTRCTSTTGSRCTAPPTCRCSPPRTAASGSPTTCRRGSPGSSRSATWSTCGTA